MRHFRHCETLGNFWVAAAAAEQNFIRPRNILSACGIFYPPLDKNKCPVTRFFSLWKLTWVFDGTGKNFHKKVSPVTRFFSVETNLSFWWDLEKFLQKSVPSHTFLRCGDYLKFLRGLGKFRQKDVPSYTFFFAVETNLSFWRDLEKFSQKSVPSHMFLRCGDYLKFLMGLRKISTKICAQIHVFSLWRLIWVFDGTWKNFHEKVCPVTCFFAVETILSFWGDLESFGKKMWPVTRFFRCGDHLKCLSGLGKFRQNVVTSYTFFSQCRLS